MGEVLIVGIARPVLDQPLEGVLDVIGRELPSVMEADAMPEIKGDAFSLVGDRPVFGKRRHGVEMGVELDQPVVELFANEVVGRGGRVEDLVEGSQKSLDPEGPVVPRREFGALPDERRRGAGRGDGDEQGEER